MEKVIGQAKYKKKRGILMLTYYGFKYTPYVSNTSMSTHHGDSFSLSITGIFGSLNLINKLENEDFEEVLNEKESMNIDWAEISDITGSRWKGTIEIKLTNGEKIQVLDMSQLENINYALSQYKDGKSA